jgi:hypothetical protein
MTARECHWRVGAHSPSRASTFSPPVYLLYLDAFGTPDQQDASRHYVLLGICVHEGTWFALNRRMPALKQRHTLPGQDFELHAAQFAVSIHEQDEVPDFEHLSYADRRARVRRPMIPPTRTEGDGPAEPFDS